MRRSNIILAAISAALALSSIGAPAHAATWLVQYQAFSGSPFTANLTLEVEDILNAVGGYDVTGVSGDVDGDVVTGLIENPGQPFPSYSADGMFIFDNVLWNSNPTFSNPGLFFQAASGNEYNLFSDNPTTYELYRARSGVGYLDHSVGSIVAAVQPPRSPLPDLEGLGGLGGGAAVPEPGTWALLILGFGAVGAVLRRRHAAGAAI